MNNKESLMLQLLKYAQEKMENNNAYPFCAFIVKDGVVISRAYNERVNLYGDRTTHGEMEAIKKASMSLHNGADLSGYSIYSTCEPCLACFDALLWTGLKDFVFSVDHNDFPEYFNDHKYNTEDYERDNPNDISITRNILHEEGIALFNNAKQKYGW